MLSSIRGQMTTVKNKNFVTQLRRCIFKMIAGETVKQFGIRPASQSILSPSSSVLCIEIGRRIHRTGHLNESIAARRTFSVCREAWRIVLNPTISRPGSRPENVEWLCAVRNRSGDTCAHCGDDFIFISRPNPTAARGYQFLGQPKPCQFSCGRFARYSGAERCRQLQPVRESGIGTARCAANLARSKGTLSHPAAAFQFRMGRFAAGGNRGPHRHRPAYRKTSARGKRQHIYKCFKRRPGWHRRGARHHVELWPQDSQRAPEGDRIARDRSTSKYFPGLCADAIYRRATAPRRRQWVWGFLAPPHDKYVISGGPSDVHYGHGDRDRP